VSFLGQITPAYTYKYNYNFDSTNERKMYWVSCKNLVNEVIWRFSTSLIPSTFFNEPHRSPQALIV
jgi:hypothetical protein